MQDTVQMVLAALRVMGIGVLGVFMTLTVFYAFVSLYMRFINKRSAKLRNTDE